MLNFKHECLSAWVNSSIDQQMSVGIGHSGDRRIYPLIFHRTENILELNLYLNSFLQEWIMATNNCEGRATIYKKWLLLKKTGSTGIISLQVTIRIVCCFVLFFTHQLVAVKISFISLIVWWDLALECVFVVGRTELF